MTVRAVTTDAKYVGQQPEGRFIEVVLEVTTHNGESKLELHVPKDVMLIDQSGKQFAAIGVPLTSGAYRSLSRGSMTFSADFSASTNGSILPLAVVFEVPSQASGLKLRVKDLPLVAIE